MTVTINGTSGITGNGSGLTNLPAANLTGNLPSINGSALTGISFGGGTMVTLSGAINTITGIPAGVARVYIGLHDQDWQAVGTGALFQMGTSSGIKTTGYKSQVKCMLESAITNFGRTDGMCMKALAAYTDSSGMMVLLRMAPNSNLWSQSHSFMGNTGNNGSIGAGMVDMGAELTQIRFQSISAHGNNSGYMSLNWSF